MDPELLALIARLADAENPLTNEELSLILEQIVAVASDIDPAEATDDDLQVLSEAHTTALAVRAEQETRAQAALARAQRAAELQAEIAPPVPEEPEADVEAEVEPVVVDEPVEPVVDDLPAEPVAASTATPAPPPPAPPPPPERRLPTIQHLAARSPRSHRPMQRQSTGAVLKAAGDLPGISAGHEVDSERWARGVVTKWEALRRVSSDSADGERVYMGQITHQYPSERYFHEGDDELTNERKINQVSGPSALAASGGVCAPVAVDYNVSTIAQASRPVRDALAGFGASRGGLRFILPHTLAQVTTDGPAALWTQANDIALNSPATKPHATFTCQTVQEQYVDAVTSIVQFGNFQARYFPEQIDQYMSTVNAVHARLAEATILDSIRSGSTAVTAEADLLSATRDILATIDRAAAAYRYRHRMPDNAPLRLIFPAFVEDLMRADLARQLPGDSGSGAERLAVADSQIDNFFAVRGINVTESLDSPTAMTGVPTNKSGSTGAVQGFGVQGVGMLLPWPTIVQMYLFHEGAWMFLDGGELNLGMVRDSTLNRTNDFQMFTETFEKTIFRGHESLSITMDICPSGMTAGTKDTSVLCLYGS